MRKLYLILIGLCALLCFCYCVNADESINIKVLEDGTTGVSNADNYDEVCQAEYGGKAVYDSTNPSQFASSWIIDGYYSGYRYYICFDTENIPDDAIITSGHIIIRSYSYNSDWIYRIVVVQSWIDCGDFENLVNYYDDIDKNNQYSNQFRITSDDEYYYIPLNNLSWLNKESNSQCAFIDYDHDLSCTPPDGIYATGIYNDEWDVNYYRPQLVVNYTIDAGSCEGVVWVNFTDSNMTLNVSVDKSDDSNTSSYAINEDNWLYTSALSLAPELMLIIFLSFFFYFAEKKKSFVLYCITTVIALIAGVYYLGWEIELSNRVIGIALILFSVYTSFLALANALNKQIDG